MSLTFNQKRRFVRYIKQHFEEVSDLEISEWVVRYLTIPMRMSPGKSGPFSFRGMNYLKEPLDLCKGSSVTDIILCWGVQLSKTTLALLIIAWWVDVMRRPWLLSMDSTDNARFLSETRLTPLIDENPRLSRHKPSNPDDDKKLEKHLKTCTGRLIGSNSPGKAASFSAQLAIQDEVDKAREGGGEKEARSWMLVNLRTKAYGVLGKRIMMSTPTTDDGPIWVNYLRGDQRKYHVPCPHCKEKITLEFEHLKFDHCKDESGEWDYERVMNDTFYKCQKCGGRIEEKHKEEMDENGEWIATNPKAPPFIRSYHLTTLYSAFDPWGKIAVEFLSNKDDPDFIKNLKNSYLAEPYVDKYMSADEAMLSKCAGEYSRCDKTLGSHRIMTVDVQGSDLRYNIRGYDDDKSYLIDHGSIATFDEIEDLQDEFNVGWVGVDGQYGTRAQEVLDVVSKNRNRKWMVIIGKGAGQITSSVKADFINPKAGKTARYSGADRVRRVQINSNVWKPFLGKARIGEVDWWTVYKNPSRQYTKELFMEKQYEVHKNGKRVGFEWKSKGDDNHQFDLETYQLALAYHLSLTPKSTKFKNKKNAAPVKRTAQPFMTATQLAKMGGSKK